MEKSKELQLFCYTHKIPDYGLTDDEYRTPVHVGKALHPETAVCSVCDNTGDNISERNGMMRELTGMYWVWKNISDIKYVGSEHYRRKFALPVEKILKRLKTYDVIIFKSQHWPKEYTLEGNYCACHSSVDFFAIEEIIRKYYPQYVDGWNRYIKNGNQFIMANCFICKKEIYDKACEFIFGVLDKFIAKFDLTDEDKIREHVEKYSVHSCPPDHQKNGWDWVKYQEGICGFIAERLTTLFILTNYSGRYFESEIIELEKNK